MRSVVLLALTLLLPSSALAQPWYDQAWAEELVSNEFPDYWTWINEVRETSGERYIDLLHQGQAMALNRKTWPELVEAWENRFHAMQHYRELVQLWKASPESQGDEIRLRMISAAEDIHLSNLEFFDARLAVIEAQGQQLQLKIADHEVNFDLHALETVERSIGPTEVD